MNFCHEPSTSSCTGAAIKNKTKKQALLLMSLQMTRDKKAGGNETVNHGLVECTGRTPSLQKGRGAG